MIRANEGGEKTGALNTREILDHRGNVIAEVEQHPSIAVKDEIETNKEASETLREVEIIDWMETLKAAADNLETRRTETELVENIARSTGNPITSVDRSVQMIEKTLREMDRIMDAQLPGAEIEALNDPVQENYALVPEGRNLGLIAPSNHPSVLAIPSIALGTQTPLAIRPSQDDVFTSHALVESLYEAGVPDNSIYFLPGGRDVTKKVIDHSDQAIAFGGEQLQQRYDGTEDIYVYGPGESTIYVDEEFTDEERVYNVVEEAMMRDGGQGCINASHVLTNGDPDRVTAEISNRISDYELRDILVEDAVIPAFKDHETAANINEFIAANTDSKQTNNTAEQRLIELNGATYLRPTVVRTEDYDSELATELPFQYITVTQIDEGNFEDAISGSLSLTLFTENEELDERALHHPEVSKVYADGAAPNALDPTEPHEGYITDTLLQKKAYRPG
jgi:acyl-CoA reductase-like NAD-dependent aldehyde dehydrogenase